MSKYSVVIPCYCSLATIRKVVEMTAEELERLGYNDYEFVLVNDCSPDEGKTAEALFELARDYNYVTAIDLAKNVGQHNALMAALNYAEGNYIISMDDDMQTHPSQLCYLIDEIHKGYDVVYGYYPQKKHSLFRNFGSMFNSWTGRVFIDKPKSVRTSSYWVMQKFVRDSIIEYKNSHTYISGLILRTTNNVKSIPIKHFKREVGSSNYTFKALIRLWSGIIGFSIRPLKVTTMAGYFFAALGFVAALAIVISKLVHPQMAVGWPSIMAGMSFFFGLTFLFMGLIGEYIGRMFLGMNKEPQYTVRTVIRGVEKQK